MNTAEQAYSQKLLEAQSLIEQIQSALTEHAMKQSMNGGTEKTNYGHIGDISIAVYQLTMLRNQLTNKGDY
jgi:hypothetical protein